MKHLILILFVALNMLTITNIHADTGINISSIEYRVNTLSETNDKILNTVYRALGAFITGFFGLLALNFYQNFAINKRKIDEIKKEIDSDSQLKDKKLEIKFKELENNIETKFKGRESNLADAMKSNEEKLNSKIDKGLEDKYQSMKNLFGNLNDQYLETKRSFLLIQSERYAGKGQMGELYCLLDILKMDIKKNRSFRISQSLELIDTYTKKNISNAKVIGEIVDILKDISDPKYEIMKNKIEENLRKKES